MAESETEQMKSIYSCRCLETVGVEGGIPTSIKKSGSTRGGERWSRQLVGAGQIVFSLSIFPLRDSVYRRTTLTHRQRSLTTPSGMTSKVLSREAQL